MDERPIPTLDNRNARSWRVPNDPSPKSKPSTDRTLDFLTNVNSASKKRSRGTTSGSKTGPSVPSNISETSSDAPLKNKLRSRMWKLLFTNVDRSVDELYYFCEDENDYQKSKDALSKLRRCVTDFEKLLTRCEEQRKFEEGENISICWDVRKTSVGVRRLQVVEVEEYASVNDSGDPIQSADNTPKFKEDSVSSRQQSDPRTPGVNSKLRAIAEPFKPTCKEKGKDEVNESTEGHEIAAKKAAPSVFHFEEVEMDTSPKNSTTPNILEVTVVSSPGRVHMDSSPQGKGKMKCSVARPTDEKHNATGSVEKGQLAFATNRLPTKIGRSVPVSSQPSISGSSEMGDKKYKSNKKPNSVPSNMRSRSASESKAIINKRSNEEDIVVTEEMMEATNAVWAEAEAWVEAEYQAEEIAWKQLEGLTPPLKDSPTYDIKKIPSLDSAGHSTDKAVKAQSGNDSNCDYAVSTNEGGVSNASTQNTSIYRYSTPPPPSRGSRSDSYDVLVSPNHTVNTNISEIDFADDSGMASPGSISTSPSHRYASLHDKLSSPERRKLTPAEARQRLDEKLLTAENNRSKSVSEIKEKAMVQNTRVKEAGIRATQRLNKAEQTYAEKLRGAEKRHDDYIKNIKDKAGNENAKVSEVIFINSFNEKILKDELNCRLTEVENKILAGRHRKEQLLQGIKDQRRKRNNRKAEQMSELRLNLEREKMKRWEALQTRLKTVQDRRQARMEELQRRSAGQSLESIVPTMENSDHVATVDINKNNQTDLPVAGYPMEMSSIIAADDVNKRTHHDLALTDSASTECVGMEKVVSKEFSSTAGKNNNKTKKKKTPDTATSAAECDEDSVLEQLAQSAKEQRNTEAELKEWKHQLISSGLQGSIEHAIQGETSQSAMRNFFMNAALLVPIGRLDPFQFTEKEVARDGGNTSLSSAGKTTFLADLQAAIKFACITTRKKRKKAKTSPPSILTTHCVAEFSGKCLTDFPISTDVESQAQNNSLTQASYHQNTFRSCLKYKDSQFGFEMSDYIRRSLRISDTNGLTLCTYNEAVVCCPPDSTTIKNFIDTGGLFVCLVALHHCTGLMHDEESFRNSLEEVSYDNSPNKKCCLALLSVQAVEWCIRCDVKNVESLLCSAPLIESIISLSCVLLQTFSTWHNDAKTDLFLNDGIGRNGAKKCSIESRSPVKDSSKGATPHKSPGHKLSGTVVDSVQTGKGNSSAEGMQFNAPPEYLCLLLPLLSSLNSIINCVVDTASTRSTESSFIDSTVDKGWLAFLFTSTLLQRANDAMRDLHTYTDLHGGSSNIFHSIIYELSMFLCSVSKVMSVVRSRAIIKENSDDKLNKALDHAGLYIQSEGIGLASNLVQVLSALLLRDLSTLKHPVGDHSHISKSVMSADKGTGASSIGGGWDRNMALPPPQILWCSFKIMEALNALSMLDILAVQSIPEILKVSLVHTSSLLLVVLFQIIEDRQKREAKKDNKVAKKKMSLKMNNSKWSMKEQLSHARPAGWCPEMIGPGEATLGLKPLFVCLGYFCLTSPENQTAVVSGTPPSLLQRLCRMPIRYLTDERLKHQILPTLIAMCADNPVNIRVLHSAELSPALLTDYLSRLIESDKLADVDSTVAVVSKNKKVQSVSSIDSDPFDPVQELKNRIPSSLWQSLLEGLKFSS